MKCPKCTHDDSKVIESRDTSERDSIRRRRECLSCGYRYTTYERVERPNLAIIKKNGDRELFDRHKLTAAILRSVGKFLRSDIEVEEIVSAVEDELHSHGMSEMPSKYIGDAVLGQLARKNEVAYVRFASVYRGFSSLDEFEAAIAEARSMKS
ncbi:transcriptional repressor NrdR [Candidatus Saccharibacteria bacterium]|nr:transcriptional repressor NrdR [Candidatus Saccharibacteria bacterium]NCU40287.1 transcriptional repressor NrdR [Candidatus Saccharibacteria bacterium]